VPAAPRKPQSEGVNFPNMAPRAVGLQAPPLPRNIENPVEGREENKNNFSLDISSTIY
tara:strand:+ start:1589 stop:1762 length:174 start_codon:yes stop_codon:yes gene_type:complete